MWQLAQTNTNKWLNSPPLMTLTMVITPPWSIFSRSFVQILGRQAAASIRTRALITRVKLALGMTLLRVGITKALPTRTNAVGLPAGRNTKTSFWLTTSARRVASPRRVPNGCTRQLSAIRTASRQKLEDEVRMHSSAATWTCKFEHREYWYLEFRGHVSYLDSARRCYHRFLDSVRRCYHRFLLIAHSFSGCVIVTMSPITTLRGNQLSVALCYWCSHLYQISNAHLQASSQFVWAFAVGITSCSEFGFCFCNSRIYAKAAILTKQTVKPEFTYDLWIFWNFIDFSIFLMEMFQKSLKFQWFQRNH